MNKITINNQEFEETTSSHPIADGVWYQHKWYAPKKEVLFVTEDGVNIYKGDTSYGVRKRDLKMISMTHCDTVYVSDNFIEFSTKELAQEYIDKHKPKEWEILSFKGKYSTFIRYKNKYNMFPHGEYNLENRDNEFSEKELLNDSWYSIYSVKRLFDGEIFSIGDKCIAKNGMIFTIDEFKIEESSNSTMTLYAKYPICGDYNNVCLSYINKYVPKFTFGKHECNFVLVKHHFLPNTVEVTCKGETGTHLQIEEILKNYFRPCKFGNVEVKSFTYKNVMINLNNIATIKVTDYAYDINNVDEITIGCLTGKYKELVNIYNHCLTLLK
ncbi:MAG TPA: hypothetical protein PKD00_03145 [Burkholderiales bacterium]|nr:hypothetical protein [Burkholderiales bacterium]